MVWTDAVYYSLVLTKHNCEFKICVQCELILADIDMDAQKLYVCTEIAVTEKVLQCYFAGFYTFGI